MPAPDPEFLPLAYFASGILATLVVIGLWHLVRFIIDIQLTRARARQIEISRPHDDGKASEAWERVAACRSRLRFNPNPNPEWVAPLIDEIPRLVLEIAVIYYPNHPEPIQAPRLSEFARAVQFVATDVAELLQFRRMGRLIDLSAGQTVRALKTGHRVWKNPKLQKARGLLQPLFKVGKPLWQVARYNSPITWVSLTASNAAVRTIHPSIINIVARRAIDLYSGKLNESPVDDATSSEPASLGEETGVTTLKANRPMNVLRSLKKRLKKNVKSD